jgi:PilZ domain
MKQERRGLRFSFDARAEVAPEESPSKTVVARVTELSLNGCFIQTAEPFTVNALILVKVFQEGVYFEGKARVAHVQAMSGMGVSFRELKPHCQSVLQKWIL